MNFTMDEGKEISKNINDFCSSFFYTKSGGKFSTLAAFIAVIVGTFILSLLAFSVSNVSSALLITSNVLLIIFFIFSAIKIYEFSGIILDFGRTRLAQQENRY